MIQRIGVTERADPTINKKWMEWVWEGNPAILITKMPRLLYTDLEGNENAIIHCTITGLGGTKIEPGIDTPEVSLQAYNNICDLFGEEKVVLRIDPIIPELQWDTIEFPSYLECIKNLSKKSRGRTRISFMDNYPHVRERFSKKGLTINQSFHSPIEIRRKIWKELGEPEVCGEPGLPVTPCVSKIDCEILKVEPSNYKHGQRNVCACLGNKIELCMELPRCTYGCLYCYLRD